LVYFKLFRSFSGTFVTVWKWLLKFWMFLEQLLQRLDLLRQPLLLGLQLLLLLLGEAPDTLLLDGGVLVRGDGVLVGHVVAVVDEVPLGALVEALVGLIL
jgi:hypothetical protein